MKIQTIKNSNGWSGLLITGLLIGCMVFAGCKQEEPRGQRECSTYGTFVRVSCGVSIYNNLWIKLDDGRLLQPCQSDIVHITEPNYYEGQRIKFGYVKADKNNACVSMITCMAVTPPHEQIRVTCLEPQGCFPTKDCNLTGTLRNYNMLGIPMPCGWVIEADNGEKILPENLPANFILADGKRVSFSYQEIKGQQNTSCPGTKRGKITCIKEINDGCNLTGTLIDGNILGAPMNCGWMIHADNGQKILPVDLPSSFELVHGKRVTFAYINERTRDNICPGTTYGKITCIRTLSFSNQ